MGRWGTGGHYPNNCFISTNNWGDGQDLGVSSVVTDKTMAGGEGTQNSAGERGFTCWVLGTVYTSARDCIIWGDSIAYGDVEDANTSGGDAYGNLGMIERLLGLNNYTYINQARSSTKAAQWQAGGTTTKRQAALSGIMARCAINELSHNDWSETLTTWKVYMATCNTALLSFAGRVINCTTTPYATSSSDGYLTQGNQTLQAGSNLQSFNAAVRAGQLTNQTGYIDISAAVAYPGAEQYWKTPADTGYSPVPSAALTGDGTHPLLYGNQYAIPLISASALIF